MAGGNLSPRQKMINLMYLVFIAMMALNMSKEVLSAFGLMNEKFESANKTSELVNDKALQALSVSATENSARYKKPFEKAQKIKKISNNFYTYIESLKKPILEKFPIDPETKQLPFEKMDKGDIIDNAWFISDGYTDKGNEIINTFATFRSDFKDVVSDDVKYQFLMQHVDERFSVKDVTNSEGIEIPYLSYHYKGFPAIASLSKLSALQNDIREIENEAYNLLAGNTLKQAASMTNFRAYVLTDKSVYFSGEKIKGRVVLGRFDDKTIPTKVTVDGRNIRLSDSKSFKDGQVQINTTAGGIGEHKFKGQFVFTEDGNPIEVKIQDSNYVVVGRPKTATIAADKMNVVYLGLDNPISASFSGVPSNKVTVTASSGSLRKKGDGQYMLKPSKGARNVTITVKGVLSDGGTVTDKKSFRVKQIPKPLGTIRGEYSAKGTKDNLKICTIAAKLPDFVFDVNIATTSFTISFPNNLGSVRINGTKLNEEAKRKVDRLRSGDIIRISSIKAKIKGTNIILKNPTDATYKIL